MTKISLFKCSKTSFLSHPIHVKTKIQSRSEPLMHLDLFPSP